MGFRQSSWRDNPDYNAGSVVQQHRSCRFLPFTDPAGAIAGQDDRSVGDAALNRTSIADNSASSHCQKLCGTRPCSALIQLHHVRSPFHPTVKFHSAMLATDKSSETMS